MNLVFLLSGAVALGASVMMVTRRNPVYGAVWLLFAFLAVAVTYLSLQAPFLAAIHVLVYTGAILVLFLFVIMLLNLRDDELGDEHPVGARAAVAAMCAVLFGALAVPIWSDASLWVPAVPSRPDLGSVEVVGGVLYNSYGLQFELVSLLILVAMFGAVVLAKKRLPTETQVEVVGGHDDHGHGHGDHGHGHDDHGHGHDDHGHGDSADGHDAQARHSHGGHDTPHAHGSAS